VPVTTRRTAAADTEECSRIVFEAFKAVADEHGVPPDFPTLEIATARTSALVAHPRVYALAAELDRKIIGFACMDERSSIAGIGPVAVDPRTPGSGAGRTLMRALMARAQERRHAGVRLVQEAYNCRSLSLYAKLGFDVREPLSILNGPQRPVQLAGYPVRRATRDDAAACNTLCSEVHGHDRAGELEEAIHREKATVVERAGRITGYATGIGWTSHAVGRGNEEIKALIGAALAITGAGFFVPTRNGELLRWCFDNGLRLVAQATLMTVGSYNEPVGTYLPSILY